MLTVAGVVFMMSSYVLHRRCHMDRKEMQQLRVTPIPVAHAVEEDTGVIADVVDIATVVDCG